MSLIKKRQPKRWPYFLALILLLGAAAWLLNVSKPGSNVTACLDSCSRHSGTSPTNQLRVLSMNMLHGYPGFAYLEQRTALLIEEIGRLNVDVVLLQEVPWTREHGHIARRIAEQLGYNFVYYRANGNLALIGLEEGEVILSRYPLTNFNFTELKPAPAFFENRVVLQATILTPQGAIDFFVTHLANGQPADDLARAEDLRSFVEESATNPAIVAGDFNAYEDSPPILRLTEQWQDSFRLFEPTALGPTCCADDVRHASPTELNERIDYVFLVPGTEKNLTVQNFQLVFTEPFEISDGRLWLSDHVGLLLTVSLESQEE